MKRRPLLLDLFSGAGGASVGYHRAGFDVVGVDVKVQPHYPFEFWEMDALELLRNRYILPGNFVAIHASPPCQAYSRATAWRGGRADHPDLIAAVREGLRTTGLPYVIENVQEARYLLRDPFMLCGSMFEVPTRSHRWFEVQPQLPLSLMPRCQHLVSDVSRDHGFKQPESVFRDAIGCEWMTVKEAREAIPPAMTYFIGEQLLEHLNRSKAMA